MKHYEIEQVNPYLVSYKIWQLLRAVNNYLSSESCHCDIRWADKAEHNTSTVQ